MSEPTAACSKRPLSASIIIGLTLFAVFFGAGNLIFPPFLGMQAGEGWLLGFLCFVLADAGLAIFAVLAIVRSNGSIEKLLTPLGKTASTLLSTALILCVGPLVAIPRTCATTFEMGIVPLIPGFNSWLFSLLFFAIVALMSIRPSGVVDIIGKFLTPLLLLTLAILCVKGILSPIGEIAEPQEGFQVAKEGLLAGYQTMDVLGAIPFTLVVLKTAQHKGFSTRSQQYKVMIPACLIAFAGLFLVYGGLCYLGATTSTLDIGPINQPNLVILVTQMLLKRFGVVLLAMIVLFACLTTAIGLTSSASAFFAVLFKNKISYRALVLIICLIGILISNIGISSIIRFAGPILTVLYPVLLSQLFLSFFTRRIKNPNVFRGAALGALIMALLDSLYHLGLPIPLIDKLPLFSLGFTWILSSLLGGIIGAFIPPPKGLLSSAFPDPTYPSSTITE